MTDELKPCPFCCGTPYVFYEKRGARICCPDCQIFISTSEIGEDALKELAERWNTISIEEQICETKQKAADAWNRRNETELAKQFMMLRSLYINKDKDLIVKIERSEPNVRMSFPLGISYNFDNIRDLNDVEKDALSKLLTDVKKELCDGVPYEFSSYSCRACESAQRERESQLVEKIKKLEAENKRLREALELIAKAKFYFARGEEEKQIRRVCEIAEDALKGCSE